MTTSRDDDDADLEWEDDSEDDSSDESTIPCPYCGCAIFEDTPRCPSCERYLSEDDRSRPSRPAWVVATALLCLAAALWWILRGA